MRIFATLLACGLLASSAFAAPQQQQQQAYAGYNPYLNQAPTTTPAPIIHPPAQVHYVNIGQELNGDYKFGYDTGKGPSGQSFREETRLPDGTVKGQYGYLDALNKMRIVKYTAGLNGFQIDSDSALSDQQLAASRPSHPVQPEQPKAPQQQQYQQPQPQYQQPQQQAPSYYQPQQQPKAPQYQGLASAASSQPASIAQYAHAGQYNSGQYNSGQYNPAAYAAPSSPQQPSYSGYSAAPQAYNPASLPSYSASPGVAGYPPNQLTPEQIRQQAALSARSRQAALARQQQQEAIIRQQQQAATETILAQQKAAHDANTAAQAQYAAQRQPQYDAQRQQYAPSQSYAPTQSYSQPQQPSYQQYQPSNYQQSNYASPVTHSTATSATAPAASVAPQQQSYGPRHTSSEMKPDLLSNFIQLPGVKLIQLDRKPQPKPAGGYPGSFGLNSAPGQPGAKPEDDYQGPVVINAALLSYNIGANQPVTPAPSKAKA